MCGISGIFSKHITDQHLKIIDRVMQNQFNRGPDHQGKLLIEGFNSKILLGHNRLTIIDLSQDANQPMCDITGRYYIVFNGEIYNFIELREELKNNGLIFKTKSDTEVVLNAFAFWGIKALSYFRGPFAFALFDSHTDELWLCRDRFGIRPLYYLQNNNEIYFASTTKTLAKIFSLKPNLAYISRGLQYLTYENGDDNSPYENLFSVPAASYLKCSLDTGKIWYEIKKYYDLSGKVNHLIETLPINNSSNLFELLKYKFENAVEIRLRTDVPFAISLSGGLDSSSVAAIVSNRDQNVQGFSFGHPNNPRTEGPIVADCANFLKIGVEFVAPKPFEMIEALYKTIEIQDAPFPNLSIVAQFLLYKKVRDSGIKVLLGGQGGDEVFMGYKKFLFFEIQQLIKQKKYLATTMKLAALFPMFVAELKNFPAYWHHRSRYMKQKQKNNIKLPNSTSFNLNNFDQPLWQRQLEDIMQFSLPTLLRYEDRNSLGNSVESRLPFMDHELVELGLALPAAIKLRAGFGKWVIREIMQNKIPEKIRLARYKRGFDIPLEPLLKQGLGKSIRDNLLQNKYIVEEFLKESININKIFSDQCFRQNPFILSEAITLLWLRNN